MEGLFQVMPPLSAEEYAELKADIQARGVMVPIEYDESGAVLDGHHRLKACMELGLKEWPSVVRLGMDVQAKTLHAIKLNCARRHLTTAGKQTAIQKALQAAPEKSDRQLAKAIGVHHETVGAQRKELESTGGIRQLDRTVGADGKERPRQVERKAPEPELILNVGESHIYEPEPILHVEKSHMYEPEIVPPRMISIQVAAPSQVSRVAAKATAVLSAAQDDPSLSRVVDQMERSGKVNAAHRQVTKLQAAEAINAEPIPMPAGPFRVIVADPPWHYESRVGDFTHRADLPYPSMQIDEICALPVGDLAHEDCILWLWTTNAHMRESYAVLDAWGFQSKTILTWAKDRIGTGDWLRGQTEHCHLAIRGKPTILTTGQGTVIHGPLQAHSQKPDSFYALVDAICPGSKLEMFCRSPREGWAAWGNMD